MAAIVTKFQGFGRPKADQPKGEQAPGHRAGRVARVSAKAAGRSKKSRDADDDSDSEAEAVAGDDGEVVEKPARADGGTYLSMYFKDMAQLDVLRPEEEFTSARELETLEIMLWEAVLAYPPAVEHVLAAIEVAIQQLPPEVRALRKAADSADARDAKAWGKLAAKAARKLRASDTDHLFIDAALLTIDRVTVGIGVRGNTVGTLGRERARAEWLRKVHQANRAAADARNDFVKANLRLVVSIARRFNHGRMALADLIQEGNIGLMKAVERYDYRRGFRFSTYASWWIRHAISRALADKGREVRLPVHMIDAQHRLTKARRQLTGSLGRQPTSEELAKATQMPLDKIEKMRSWLLESSVSLDKPVGDDEGRVLGEVLEDPDREEFSPTGELEWEALTMEVRDLLRELRPIEADILRQRFGLGTEQELTLKQIGDKYNLSRERIRQLQEQALGKMRRALARRDLM
ncbi:MAG: sigma-70 family RNA polymerase sigma factor [Deltaproteobacteria bacterium]|nr:sigma-70 family RNA polymerase sigma factor [Deltaproteobacteria bacterium]MDQ3300897.1 sigma-70 family RNA polymerase sigma factor [Myxococcota bacterium]